MIDRNGLKSKSAASPSLHRQLDNLQELNYQHLLYFWTVARDGSIADACARLQLSQPTISMQIRKLEKMLGHRLFDRSGRKLVLTEIGHTVYDYADEMFSLGRELLGTLRGMPGKRSGRLHVGIPTFLPKVVTYRLLEPVLHLPNQVQLICHEDDMDDLIDGLARHRFDVILTDTPIHSASSVRAFNHPLGKCDIAVCGVPALAQRYRDRFPVSLDGAPFLLPTMVTQLRRSLERWFDEQPFQPRIVGEFDDSALMKEFGKAGAGLFTIPSAVMPEVMEQYGLELVGRIPHLTVSYFAVTTERKLTHPATIVIAERAKTGLLRDHQYNGG
ncbi:MAG: LysR family transcriptional regulator [Planctomycetes bacterium]|nr:LysR family transcriptional regulator [Planctomycetota bacterium]